MEEFYAVCQEVHIGLLRALQAGFLERGIAIDLLTPCSGNVSEMRLNYYPPIVSPHSIPPFIHPPHHREGYKNADRSAGH